MYFIALLVLTQLCNTYFSYRIFQFKVREKFSYHRDASSLGSINADTQKRRAKPLASIGKNNSNNVESFRPLEPTYLENIVHESSVESCQQLSIDLTTSSKSSHVLSDSDEEDDDGDEGEAVPATTEAPSEGSTMSLLKGGVNFPSALNGSDVRVGIIATRWNSDILSGLYKGVNESLTSLGVKPSNVFTTYVPGAFEIPITAKFLSASKRFDVIICLGCLIKGETMHFEYIAQATSSGIMQVQLETLVPMVFGVLTVLNKEQAIARSTGLHNEGISWGKTAVEMGLARMQALGIGRPSEKTPGAASFVTFDNTSNATVEAAPKEDKKKPKPFGF